MIIVDSSVDDDNRIYFIDTSRIRRIDGERPRLTSTVLPTDDPDRFTVQVTETLPQYILMKELVQEEMGK